MLSSFEPVMGAMRQRPWIGPVLGFLLGLIVGLPILGWYVFPVKWVDADVVHLRADLQDDYIRMVAGSYAQNRDIELAARRMLATLLGPPSSTRSRNRTQRICSRWPTCRLRSTSIDRPWARRSRRRPPAERAAGFRSIS